jgi:hypothetical protein
MTICGLFPTNKGDTLAESISVAAISNIIENNLAIACTENLPFFFYPQIDYNDPR